MDGVEWHSAGGDYKPAFQQFKDKSAGPPSAGFNQLEIATGYFMGTSAATTLDSASSKFIAAFGKFGGFENPGTPHLDRRFTAAKQVFKSFGSGTIADVVQDSNALATGNVSSADAACDSVGAIDCTSTTEVDQTTQAISQVRKNVVCVALAELAKWESGKMKPGGDFKTYSQGRDEEWCADFASYVYNKAGYPINRPQVWDGGGGSGHIGQR